jgi:primosomal protein N' (replication factor Y)
VSVVPAVAGIDRVFDYVVPDELAPAVRTGSVVRIDLAGRRVGGWVVADGVVPPGGLALRPLARVSGWGPEPEVVDLSAWVAWRWAGRRRSVLSTASSDHAVVGLPVADRRAPVEPPSGDLTDLVAAATADAVGILRLPPGADPTAVVARIARRGPTLIVVPSAARAAVLAGRLRRAGAGVAELPQHWALARAGAGVVIGTRAAALAPCPGLAAVVVLDAHDEGLVQEQVPAWWASAVAVERARRAGVPCVLVSACPTLDLLAAGRVVRPSVQRERSGWAPLEVVDRRDDDPRLGLYSERLVAAVRAGGRVVCVLNRTGRARLLACHACRAVARCEHCGAAVVQAQSADAASAGAPADGLPARALPARALHPLVCARCGTQRPPVCLECHSTRLRQLRTGVAKAREELETLAGRPVGELTATTTARPDADVVVGTEAVLHRIGEADLVAFLDFDQELLAPRLRAAEEALALLARASRLVGGHRRGGRVIVQTRLADHEVIEAARCGDPGRLSSVEEVTRRALRLPPYASLAALSGPGAGSFAAALRAGKDAASPEAVEVLGPDGGRWLVRAANPAALCDALAATPRPVERLRVEVDPLRV